MYAARLFLFAGFISKSWNVETACPIKGCLRTSLDPEVGGPLKFSLDAELDEFGVGGLSMALGTGFG